MRMRIIVERSKTALVIHSLFIVSAGINIIRMLTQDQVWSYFNLFLWNMIAYVLYFNVTALKSDNAKLRQDISEGLIDKFVKFMEDNKSDLMDKVNKEENISIDLNKVNEK